MKPEAKFKYLKQKVLKMFWMFCNGPHFDGEDWNANSHILSQSRRKTNQKLSAFMEIWADTIQQLSYRYNRKLAASKRQWNASQRFTNLFSEICKLFSKLYKSIFKGFENCSQDLHNWLKDFLKSFATGFKNSEDYKCFYLWLRDHC